MIGLRPRPAVPAEAEEYVREAMPRLGRLALSLTGDWASAEDLVQDTLTKVLLKWRQVAASEHVDAYVKRTMVNTFLSGKRRRSAAEVVSHQLVTEVVEPSAPPNQQEVDERAALLAMVSQLPPRQRTVLVLRYLEDCTDRQIADLLDCSPAAAGAAAQRGLATLRHGFGTSGRAETARRPAATTCAHVAAARTVAAAPDEVPVG